MSEGTKTQFIITQTFIVYATTQEQAENAVIKDDFSEVDVQDIRTETTATKSNTRVAYHLTIRRVSVTNINVGIYMKGGASSTLG